MNGVYIFIFMGVSYYVDNICAWDMWECEEVENNIIMCSLLQE